MNAKISKTNEDLAFFNARIDEIRISGHERLKAKARLAQAHAIADAAFAVIDFGKRLVKKMLAARPAQRPTTFAG